MILVKDKIVSLEVLKNILNKIISKVSTNIEEHNKSDTAHEDIRILINDNITKVTEAAQTASNCAQAMSGTYDFTGYLRYQIVSDVPAAEDQEDGVLYIVPDTE